MPPKLRPVIEVFVRPVLNDAYASARLDVTLSSLQAVQGKGVGVMVTLLPGFENNTSPLLDRFPGLEMSRAFVPSALTDNDLSYSLVAKQSYFMIMDAGSVFPWDVTPATLFDGTRAVIRATTNPDSAGIRRAAVFVGGVSAPNDIQVHEGIFVYSTRLAERAYLMLVAMHGANFFHGEPAVLRTASAYVSINDDRLEGWHSIRRSAEAPLRMRASPDVRKLRPERALDRIYAQLSITT